MAKRTTTSKLRLLQRCNWGGVPLRIPHDIRVEYIKHTCYPPSHQIFRAFELCPFDNVKVVIIGQDPYPGKGKANGLSFSSNEMTESLIQIKREVERTGCSFESGDLTSWAKQGVLLMNSSLTIEQEENTDSSGKKKFENVSHEKYWKEIITKVLQSLNNAPQPIVFLLWGQKAIDIAKTIEDNTIHIKLKASHPSTTGCAFVKCSNCSSESVLDCKRSALSCPGDAIHSFYKCDHFSIANMFLKWRRKNAIDWSTE